MRPKPTMAAIKARSKSSMASRSNRERRSGILGARIRQAHYPLRVDFFDRNASKGQVVHCPFWTEGAPPCPIRPCA
jgi:hypothetical protein